MCYNIQTIRRISAGKEEMMSLNDTPRANRLHIAIFGRRNSGKSSLINALTGQDTALVSEYAGTTTDPVYKAMELHPVGPVVFIDTAGFDDSGELGELRVKRTRDVIKKTDIAILLFEEGTMDDEKLWLDMLQEAEVPVIPVVNKTDAFDRDHLETKVAMVFGKSPYMVSAATGDGITYLKKAIEHLTEENFRRETIMKGMVKAGDLVLLVMPQDIQAPKGRLILPQVQTLRELLDSKCSVMSTTADGLQNALDAMKKDPDLIITDSQCFKLADEMKPAASRLTSFSVLFAAYKGDIDIYVRGAGMIDRLTEKSRVLIAEACTHAPLEEDIGREKIPRMLRQRCGEGLQVDVVSGPDFPDHLEKYDLIIHCGACMFNRKHVMSRIEQAETEGVPITNYGIAMAHMNGMLSTIELPG